MTDLSDEQMLAATPDNKNLSDEQMLNATPEPSKSLTDDQVTQATSSELAPVSNTPPPVPTGEDTPVDAAVNQKIFDATPAGALTAAVQGFTAKTVEEAQDITGFNDQITAALRKAGVYNNLEDLGTPRENALKDFNEAVLKPASLAAISTAYGAVEAIHDFGNTVSSITPDWANDLFMAYAAAGEPLPFEQVGDIAKTIPPLAIRPVLETKPWQADVAPVMDEKGKPTGEFQSAPIKDNNPTIVSGLPQVGTPEWEKSTTDVPSNANETVNGSKTFFDGSGNLNMDYIRADQNILDFSAQAAEYAKRTFGFKLTMDQMKAQVEAAYVNVPRDMAYGLPDVPMWRYSEDQMLSRIQDGIQRKATLELASAFIRESSLGENADLAKIEYIKNKFGNTEATRSMLNEEGGRFFKAKQIVFEDPGLPITEAAAQKLQQNIVEGMDNENLMKIASTLTTPQNVARFMGDIQKPKFTDYLQYYVFNNWLSGLITHASYMGSNILQNIIRVGAEKPLAAAIGKIQEAFGHSLSPAEFNTLTFERKELQERLDEAASTQGRPMQPLDMQKSLQRIQEIDRRLEYGQTYKFRETQAHIMGMAEGGVAALRAAGKAFIVGDRIPLPSEMADAEAAANEARIKALSEGASKADADLAARRVYQDNNPHYGNPFLERAKSITEPGVNILGAKLPISAAAKRGTLEVAGNIIGAPMMRMINGLHTFQQHLTYAESLYGNAMRQALSEGREGKIADTATDLGQRFAVLKNKPSIEMMRQASNDAKYAVYLEKSGKLSRNIQQLANTNGYTRFIIPFSKVPLNILKQRFIERTPLGLLDAPTREKILGQYGNLAQADAISRMSVGSAILGTGAYLAYQKVNHGFVSDDKNTRLFRNINGTSPYTVSIAGVNIPHRFLGDAGAAMSMGADLHDAAQAHQEGAKGYDGLIGTMGEVLRHTMLNAVSESGLTGLSELLGALMDDRGQAGRYLTNSTVAAFQPYSSFQSQANKLPFIDPFVRQTMDKDTYQQFINTWKNYTLGQSTSLAPEFDVFGNEIKHGGDHSWAEHDPVYQALDYLGIHPSQASRRLFNTTLTDEQYASFARAKGKAFYNLVQQDMSDPNWVRMAPRDQAAYVFQAVRDSEKQARQAMTLWYPDLVTQSKSRTKQLLEKYDNWNPPEQ